MVLFRHLTKAHSDLLQRDYLQGKAWKVDITHGSRGPTLTHSAMATHTGALTASSHFSHVMPWGSAGYKFSTGSMSGDFLYKFKYVPWLTFAATVDRKHEVEKGAHKLTSDVSMELSSPQGSCCKHSGIGILAPHIKVSADPLVSKWTGSITTGLQLSPDSKLYFGGEMVGHSSFKSMSYVTGLSLQQKAYGKAWALSILGYPKDGHVLGRVVGGIHYKGMEPGSSEIGAEITHDISGAQPSTITVGGLWYIGEAEQTGKDSILKVKLAQDAKLSVALTHKVSSSVTATVGSEMYVTKPDTATCGIAFKMSA